VLYNDGTAMRSGPGASPLVTPHEPVSGLEEVARNLGKSTSFSPNVSCSHISSSSSGSRVGPCYDQRIARSIQEAGGALLCRSIFPQGPRMSGRLGNMELLLYCDPCICSQPMPVSSSSPIYSGGQHSRRRTLKGLIFQASKLVLFVSVLT